MKSLIADAAIPLQIATSLAGAVKVTEYARNHHWLKLTDHKERQITLVEHAVLRYECKACSFVFVSETNIGDTKCNRCTSPMAVAWMRPQIALIPEVPSEFEMPKRVIVETADSELEKIEG